MSISRKVKEKIWLRADYSCELCGSKSGLQHHHIVKKSQGGGNNIENIILLCWHCHHSTTGVHGREGHKLDLKLKLDLQDRYRSQGKSKEEIRHLMGGRIYLEEE